MRLAFILWWSVSGLLWAAADPREIVRLAVQEDAKNFDLSRNYTFIQRVEQRRLDGAGRVKSVESSTYDVTNLYGQPYNRLIQRDDKPLPDKEERRIQAKLNELVREREGETSDQRARRLEEFRKKRQKQREFSVELPDAFDLSLFGEEVVDGQPAWVIDASPKPGYRPKDARAGRIFMKFRFRMWIDKSSYGWVKLEAESLDTVSFGLFLARLEKGCKVELHSRRVNDELWVPDRFVIRASARLALLKKIGAVIDVTYKDYRKFQSDSHFVPSVDGTNPF